MKTFEYKITDPVGIHARPAGLLVKEAKQFDSRIEVAKGEKKAEAGKLMALMSLGIKQGDTVVVSVDGVDEDTAFNGIKAFFEKNL